MARTLEIGGNQQHVTDDTDHFGPMGAGLIVIHDDITWSLSQKFIVCLHGYMTVSWYILSQGETIKTSRKYMAVLVEVQVQYCMSANQVSSNSRFVILCAILIIIGLISFL